MEIISDTTQKARQKHNCNYCGGIIQQGEVYQRQFSKDGGDNWVWKSHPECHSLAVAMNLFDDANEGVDADSFADAVNDIFAELTGLPWKEWREIPFMERLTRVKEHHNITTP